MDASQSLKKNELDPKSLRQFSDLRNLLSLKKNQKFEDELNNITINQQKILTSLKKPNWLDKLQLQQTPTLNQLDISTNLDETIQNHKRNKTTLTPLRNNTIDSNLQSTTSRNQQILLEDFHTPSSNNLRLKSTLIVQKSDRKQKLLNQTFDDNMNSMRVNNSNDAKSQMYFSNKKYSQQIQLNNKPIVVGSNLDQIFLSKENSLFNLKQKNDEQLLEIDQLKSLNLRLVERVDYLQNIIDKEASASEFYFNYPPKPDQQLHNDVKTMRNTKSPRREDTTNKSNLADAKKEDQLSKLRKIYEDKLDLEKRLSDRAYNELQLSFTTQVEDLQEILSQTINDLVKLDGEHNSLVERFNNYYQECDRYIKDRETKIKEFKNLNDDQQDQINRLTNLFTREKQEHESLQKTHTSFLEQYNIMRNENVKLREEVMMYEEKYKFIDISKMHEKVQLLSTQLQQSEKKRKIVQQELFDLRDKILRATASRFSTSQPGGANINGKPSFQGISPQKLNKHQPTSGIISPSENIQKSHNVSPNKIDNSGQNDSAWQGEEDVEQTAQALLEFIHNEISSTFPKGNQLNQWTNKISLAPLNSNHNIPLQSKTPTHATHNLNANTALQSQQNRKIQPKQTKKFSPLKTAMILDHYSPQNNNTQTQNAQIQQQMELLPVNRQMQQSVGIPIINNGNRMNRADQNTLSRSIEKSYKQQNYISNQQHQNEPPSFYQIITQPLNVLLTSEIPQIFQQQMQNPSQILHKSNTTKNLSITTSNKQNFYQQNEMQQFRELYKNYKGEMDQQKIKTKNEFHQFQQQLMNYENDNRGLINQRPTAIINQNERVNRLQTTNYRQQQLISRSQNNLNQNLHFSQPRAVEQNNILDHQRFQVPNNNLMNQNPKKMIMKSSTLKSLNKQHQRQLTLTNMGQPNNEQQTMKNKNSKNQQQQQHTITLQKRYQSQEPPQNTFSHKFPQKQYTLSTLVSSIRQDINIEQVVNDEDLLTFQKEIERRYKNAQTKTYQFPRLGNENDTIVQSKLEYLLTYKYQEEIKQEKDIKIDEEMFKKKQQMYQQDKQNHEIQENNNYQQEEEISIDDQDKLNLDSSEIKRSLINKYSGFHQKKQKEKFCDKLKKSKQLVQHLQNSTSQQSLLQVQSVEAKQNSNFQQKQLLQSQVANTNNSNYKNSTQQNFFQNTKKRVNKQATVGNAQLNLQQFNNKQKSILFTNSSIVFPMTTKNINNANNNLMENSQYFTMNNFNHSIQNPAYKIQIQKPNLQSLEKQKVQQLNNLVKKIGNTGGIQTTKFEISGNQKSGKIQVLQTQALNDNESLDQHHQAKSPKSSQKIKMQSTMRSPQSKLATITYQQTNFVNQNSTPKKRSNSKTQSLQKVISQQNLVSTLQTSNQKQMKNSVISQSYKKFKELEDQQTHSICKTSRNNSQNSQPINSKSLSQNQNGSVSKQSSNNANTSQSKRDLSDQKLRNQQQQMIAQGFTAMQSTTQNKIKSKNSYRQKLNNNASTSKLLVTGSQAINTHSILQQSQLQQSQYYIPTNYDSYSSLIKVVNSPKNTANPNNQVLIQNPGSQMIFMSPQNNFNRQMSQNSMTIPQNKYMMTSSQYQ